MVSVLALSPAGTEAPGEVNDHNVKKNLYLYEEDMKQMPRVATFVKTLVNYHTVHPSEKDTETKKPKVY